MNVNRLPGAVIALVLAFSLRVACASAADLDITGEWHWAVSPNGKTTKGGAPQGTWSGTFTISADGNGRFSGKFSDSTKMVEISYDGKNLVFVRDLGGLRDGKGQNTQTWRGAVEKKENRLVFRGRFSGAFIDSVGGKTGLTSDIVAVK
jgi:hypothetical protein